MPPEEDTLQTYSVDSEDSPEEGEILSDNQLEDISSAESYDMDFVPLGKSNRNNQHLHALCLSSVSSDTSTTHQPIVPRSHRKRQNHHHGHEHRGHCKRKRTCRRRRDSSTSSGDDDTTLDIRLKAQLKAAVKFDLIENAHKNSLRTRLNAMVSCPVNEEPKSDMDIIHDTDTIEIIGSGSEQTEDTPKVETIDDELIQLRLAALKTAICNKYAKRTKRKNDMNKENNKEEPAPQAQTNCENDNEIIGEDIKSDIPSAPSLDEDEDVLRAILLASMSKKITSYQPETVTEPIINNKNVKINHFNNVNRAFNNIKLPQVKPLIIRINSDSEDSDWDLSSQEKSPEKNILKTNHKILDKIVAEKPVNLPQENGVKCSDKLKKHDEINSQQLLTTNSKYQEQKTQTIEKCTQRNIINSSDNLTKNNNKLLKENPKNPQDNAIIVTNGKKDLEIAKLQEAKALSIIESSVEKFLKEQRAKVESRQNLKVHQKKFPVNLKPQLKKNPLHMKVQPKKNPLNIKILSKKNFQSKPKVIPNSPDLEKSAIKFLPANKMEEYHKLQSLLKQKKAQKLLLTKNKSDKSTQVVQNSLPETSRSTLENKDFDLKRKKEKQSCSSVLRATLKQLEMKNSSGRFQIQDKYKDLRPLIRNINQLNKEQKQCEQNVDRLVEELAKARQKQEELHRKMLTSVTSLADEKKKIDSSSLKSVTGTKEPIISAPMKPPLIKSTISLASTITSGQKLISDKSELKTVNQTMSKDRPSEVTDQIVIEKSAALKPSEDQTKKIERWERKLPSDSYKSAMKPVKANSVPITSTPIKSSLPIATMTLLASTITSDQSLACDKSESSLFDQTTIQNDNENKVRDQNDIEVSKKTKQVDVKKAETSDCVLPLDHHERQTPWNPLLIICPFQINGTCKDSECTFNHFQK